MWVFFRLRISIFTFLKAKALNADNRQNPKGQENYRGKKHLQFYLATLVCVLCEDLKMNNKDIWTCVSKVK